MYGLRTDETRPPPIARPPRARARPSQTRTQQDRPAKRRSQSLTERRSHPSARRRSESTESAASIETHSARIGRVGLRIMLLSVVMLLIFGVLAGRLFQVQVLERDRYAGYAANQGIRSVNYAARRGAILDRNYNVLAISDDRPTVYADPRLVISPLTTAVALASVLDIDQATVAKRLASDKHFVYVARQVSPVEGSQVENLELPGVGLTYESSRLRPNGDQLARGVLGAVDIDQNPTAGAEKQFADQLSGTAGRQVATISRDGIPLPASTSIFRAPTPGDDVVLSLHTEIQWITEQALKSAVLRHGAAGATAVVMEVDSGDLLALASVKSDLALSEASVTAHNPAYTDAFEPGSVTKAFTVAAALEEGLTTPDELIDAPAIFRYADKDFREPFRRHDVVLTTREILVKSSNIGTIKLGTRMSSDTLYQYLRAFGLGRFTGPEHQIALPGETHGILASGREWQGTQQATIAFGQGVAVTAVQLAAGFNVMASGGEYVTPRLLLGTVDAEGRFDLAEREAPVSVLSASTSEQMTRMLADVVSEGTGQRAAVSGYSVAGKTGTAQKPHPEGGYSNTNYVSSFVGFLPTRNPVLTIAVILDEPTTEHLAGLVAAPLFAEIAEHAMRILRVASDG